MGTASRPNPLAFLDEELAALRERNLYRPLRVMSSAQGPIVSIDDRRLISLSSNDYLGLTHHPRMKRAALEAVERFGAGSGAVRTIAGTMTLHEQLEADLAAFKHAPAVLTFQSGFAANTGVIPTITGETDLIVSDELNHASIIDGMRLSKAPRKIYRHADVAHLREVLEQATTEGRDGQGAPYRLILVVSDGVFSMDGDIAPLDGIVDAAEAFGAAVMVDDAHASGVLGKDGRGTVDHFGLDGRVAIQVGTLSQGRRRAGRLRGGVAGPARHPHPAGPPVPVLDEPSARRGGRLHRGDPDHAGRARAARAAVGEHPPVQGRDGSPRVRHRAQRDADHAGHPRRLRDRRSSSRTASSTRACSRRRSCSRPSPSTGHGSGRSSPPRTAMSSSTGR